MSRYSFRLAIAATIGIGLITSSLRAADVANKTAPESLEARIAQAKLQFAELGLKRVEKFNARVANEIPAIVIEDYRRDVDLAKARLQAVSAGTPDGEFNSWLIRVEARAKQAQSDWAKAESTNKVYAGTIDQVDVDRMRVRAEIFQLLYQQGKELASKPAAERLAWQNDVLLTEVDALDVEVFRNRTISGDHN